MAELISYIQHNNNAIRLSDLQKLYSQHLQQVGSSWSTVSIQPTWFKEHLLQRLGGEWQAFAKGRDVFLTSKATVGSLLSELISQDLSEDEAKKIVEVGLISRRQILKSQNPFSTATVDNIDVAAELTLNHPDWTFDKGNMGKDPSPLDMDMPNDSFIELPDDYAVVPYVEDTGGDIFLEPTGVMTQVLDNMQGRVCISEQAWLSHVLDINNKGKRDRKWQLDEIPVTYARFFSNKQGDEVRPRAVIGVFPCSRKRSQIHWACRSIPCLLLRRQLILSILDRHLF